MTDQQAPERIWASVNGMRTSLPGIGQYRIGGWAEYDNSSRCVQYIRADLLEAAEKRIADLEENMRIGNESWSRLCEARSNALTKAEAERDELAAEYATACQTIERLAGALNTALPASAAREIAMRERAAERIESIGFSAGLIRSLPLSPDATAALNEMLAEAWAEGYDAACKDDCGANGYAPNPYRKEESNGRNDGRIHGRPKG